MIDSCKTICAPYSQGNIVLFGFDADKQCAAMSMCALVYKHTSNDLIKIMNVGNDLYHVLSRLYNQDFLLLTELPNTLTVFNSIMTFNIVQAIQAI